MKSKMATGKVLVSVSESTRANMKLFQLKMNDRMPAVAMPGVESGSMRCRKAPMWVSPSTSPDSSISSGRPSKKPIMM